MAFAYFIGHAANGFWPVLNQGAPAVLFSFLWLYISSAGAGPWSLDAVLQSARQRRELEPHPVDPFARDWAGRRT
jgi:uncharacterized membrane protein YphA (DoxX/SURF4 family)